MDNYLRRQTSYTSVSGNRQIGPTITPVILTSVRNARTTIYLQRVQLFVATPGFEGSYWMLTDSTGVSITGQLQTDHSPVAMGLPFVYTLDFGADGLALTLGSNLIFDGLASDAHGSVVWDAYQKLSSTADLSASNSE